MAFAGFRERGGGPEPAVYRTASIFRATRSLIEEDDMLVTNALGDKAGRAHIVAPSLTPGEEVDA